jgi:hypothetical protein
VNVFLNELDTIEWYSYIIYYLKNFSCLGHLVDCKTRDLISNAMRYCLIQYGLGWRNPNGIILRCVNKDESNKLIKEFHSGHSGGHFAACITTHKNLRVGYYWPILLIYVHHYVRLCQPCHRETIFTHLYFEIIYSGSFLLTMGFGFFNELKDISSNGY